MQSIGIKIIDRDSENQGQPRGDNEYNTKYNTKYDVLGLALLLDLDARYMHIPRRRSLTLLSVDQGHW